jgi:predicted metal-dependent peptidase
MKELSLILIQAKMTDEQLNVLVSEIKKVAEYIGIELTIKQQEQ